MRNISFIGHDPCLDLPVFRSKPRVKIVEQESDLYRLCRLVYASDPRTNLPSGDLQLFFSDNVNPDIKDWISRQLLQPNSFGDVSSSINGKQLEDDVITACMRNRGESAQEYVERMNKYLHSINNKED